MGAGVAEAMQQGVASSRCRKQPEEGCTAGQDGRRVRARPARGNGGAEANANGLGGDTTTGGRRTVISYP